jgi:PST family polysaccharide transporter
VHLGAPVGCGTGEPAAEIVMTAEADRLGRVVLGGAASMLVARYTGPLAVIAGTAVMARWITPEEYGLVTTAIATVAIVRVLEEVGLGDVDVQRADISHEQCSTRFWINLAFGTVCMVGGAAISPLVAALSVNFPLAALGLQRRTLLRRDFRFRDLAVAHAASLTGRSASA